MALSQSWGSCGFGAAILTGIVLAKIFISPAHLSAEQVCHVCPLCVFQKGDAGFI